MSGRIAALWWLLTVPAGWAQGVGRVSGRVTADGAGVAHAVVSLVPASTDPAPKPTPAVIDQRHLRFRPRTLAVTPGSPVEFVNSDSVLHNVFGPGGPSGAFDLGTYPVGERRTRVFEKAGSHVILCHVHPEMAAYVVVVPSPFFAVTDERGEFVLAAVPRGEYRIVVTHRRRDQERGSVLVMAAGAQRLDLALESAARGRP